MDMAKKEKITIKMIKQELVCKACVNCNKKTMICQTLKQSIAHNEINPWTCKHFVPDDGIFAISFDAPKSQHVKLIAFDTFDDQISIYFRRKEVPD